MTTDRKWGTGKWIPYDDTLLDRKQLTGGNKGGLAITRLKNRYCRALGLQMPIIPVPEDTLEQVDKSESSSMPDEEYIQESYEAADLEK